MPSPMTLKVLREAAEDELLPAPSRPARCEYRLVRASESGSRHTRPCKRSGRYVITVNGTAVTRPLCWQHARRAQDATVALYLNSATVRIEEVPA